MMNNKIKIKDAKIEPLFKEISALIKDAKQKVQIAVNSGLAILYWDIGGVIKREIMRNRRADYGKYIVDVLSEKLSMEYGEGYSRSIDVQLEPYTVGKERFLNDQYSPLLQLVKKEGLEVQG